MRLLEGLPISQKEATLSNADTTTATRIDIPGDVLIPDEVFCREVLDGATRRTAHRYTREGLPFVMVRGRKFRPLNAGREWLAARIQSATYRPRRRGRASKPVTATV
jgi:hypothetical protein